MKALRWLRDYLALPLTVIGVILAWLLFKRGAGESQVISVAQELKAIRAKREVRELQIQMGAAAAKKHVEVRYRDRIESLDYEAQAKVDQLSEDPEKLAQMLERLTR